MKTRVFFFTLAVITSLFAAERAECPPKAALFARDMVTLDSQVTLCDWATDRKINCQVLAKCLEKFQRITVDLNRQTPLKFRIPTEIEFSIIKRELGIQTMRGWKTVVPISRSWTKKFATPKYREKYFMENYTLWPGENIFSVGKRYGRNPQIFVWFNGLKNPENLRGGQIIRIPDTTYRYWIDQGAAPFKGNSLAEALQDCDFSDSVKDSMLVLMRSNSYEDGYIQDGQILRTMYSAPLNKNGKRRLRGEKKVVSVFDNGEAYHAKLIKVRKADSLYISAIPDVCFNFSTWAEWIEPLPPPSEPDTVIVNTPPDSTPIDSIKPPPVEEANKLINNEELYVWGGHQFPPYWVDGSNFYGGRFNWFPGSGVFGLNLELNGWDGYGPRVEWEWYRYFGICPAGGISLEWANSKSKFTISADAAWQYDTGWNNNYYTSTQKTWFAYPSLTYLFIIGKGCWDEGYFDCKFDVRHRRRAFVSGFRTNDKPVDKSSFIFGNRYFFLNFSTNTPLTLGITTKWMHLVEDHRHELTIGPVLSINYFLKVGAQYQITFNSTNQYQNGDAYAIVADIDLWNIFRR
jgi:hypothetical protein